MPRDSSVWECQQCGAQSPKWAGRCPECQSWGSLVETAVSTKQGQGTRAKGRGKEKTRTKPQKFSDVLAQSNYSCHRISTGVGELDRVLGNGLVPGAVVLLAGEPGMGKSTLLSQVALRLAQERDKGQGTKAKGKTESNSLSLQPLAFSPSVLYVCGEESPSQVALRLRRLSHFSLDASHLSLSLLPETDADLIIDQVEKTLGTSLVIVDSVQTLTTDDLTSIAGSVSQVRECAGRLSEVSKRLNIPLFLVGHVNKEGDIAGPKVLEHVVDVVLMMEGDRSGSLRMVRAIKNRFGPVDEVGLFAMEDGGMREVINPAELLIGEHAGRASGSVLGCVLEGQRPLVLEVQALTVPSKLSVPRRVGQGVNERRLQLLCAVVERHLGLGIGEKDVFVNVAGGLVSSDPGLDLAVVGAVISSADERLRAKGQGIKEVNKAQRSDSLSPHPSSLVPILCGEVGLLGEVRAVQGWERREKEVKRLGLGQLVGKPKLAHIKELLELLH